jgi:Cupin
MDPLSDVLRVVRLDGAFFYLVEAAAPWSVLTAPARELVPRILPEAEHLVSYHVLLTGSCWGGVDGEPQVQMKPGDVIVFPHGDAHLMSSHAGQRLDPGPTSTAPQRYPGTVRIGPDADECETTFVCGFLGCDARPFNPLLASLPRRLHVSGVAGGWLSQFPQQVVAESRLGRTGGETMLTRMAELMFVEVLRRHIEQLPAERTGWLAGLTDPVVGAALSRLHERPDYPWTLAALARAIASSRTVLAERFSQLVILLVDDAQLEAAAPALRPYLERAGLLRGVARVRARRVRYDYRGCRAAPIRSRARADDGPSGAAHRRSA